MKILKVKIVAADILKRLAAYSVSLLLSLVHAEKVGYVMQGVWVSLESARTVNSINGKKLQQ